MRKNRPYRCGAKKPSKTDRTTLCTALAVVVMQMKVVEGMVRVVVVVM